MDVSNVLHMNGGMGKSSYANNSLFQQNLISLEKHIREEAITDLYSSMLPGCLSIAELGCASGPNAFIVVYEIIKIVEKLCKKMNHKSPEYKVLMNDLPGNDFNSIFKSISIFKEKLSNEIKSQNIGPSYFYGVPGSFYGRIFPNQTLHVVHSSSSLHWLSKVPEGVENNKGNILMSNTSPLNVLKAYHEQFQRDFSLFLKYRAEEIVEEGSMILTFMGRWEHWSTKEFCFIWKVLAEALNDMVLEGIIKEEEVDSFNIPLYTPSPSEVKLEVLKEGSFIINCLEVSEVNLNTYENWISSEYESQSCELFNDKGYNFAQCIKAAGESLLVSHFGEAIIEEVFSRYQKIFNDRISNDDTLLINFSVLLTRKSS